MRMTLLADHKCLAAMLGHVGAASRHTRPWQQVFGVREQPLLDVEMDDIAVPHMHAMVGVVTQLVSSPNQI